MFNEILKITPKLDNGDLSRMERTLNSRFGRVAKKFGKGLVAALAGGGIAGVALGFIDKLLNPLKETQDAIDRVLNQGDDIVTNAKQFGTTAGKLFKLQQIAKSTGLDPDSLFMLMTKFQTAVAEAAADPTKATSVRKFVPAPIIDPATGEQRINPISGKPEFQEQDTAEAFFQFIQSLRKMDKTSKLLVQQEVFGEKQVLKMSDFLETDMRLQAQDLQLRPSEEYTPVLESLGTGNDWKDILRERNEAEDIFRKGRLINAGMIESQAQREQIARQRENERIAGYKSLATIEEASAKITALIEKGMIELTKIATKASNLSDIVDSLSVNRIFKGIIKSTGKGE